MMNTTRHVHKKITTRRRLPFLLIAWFLLPVSYADNSWESRSQPPGLVIHANSRQSPLPLNQMHQWEIQVTDAQGEPIDNADIDVSGGMPEHDHGLATSPRITQRLGDGKYLLEGMRFHMPGLWKLDFTITVDHQQYKVEQTFTL